MLPDKHVLVQVTACSGYPPSAGHSPSEDLLLPGDSGDHANILGLMMAPLRPEEGRTLCKGEARLRTSQPSSPGRPQCQRRHLTNSGGYRWPPPPLKPTQPCQVRACGRVGVDVEYENCSVNTCHDFDFPSLPHSLTHFRGVGGVLSTRPTA